MAKITVVVDTDSDEMTCTVNGETLENVTDVDIDIYDDGPSISITQIERGEDLTKYMVTRAAKEENVKIYESEKVRAARSVEQSIKDYVVASRREKVEKNKNF